MAKTITELPTATTVATTDYVTIVDVSDTPPTTGLTKKATIAQILELVDGESGAAPGGVDGDVQIKSGDDLAPLGDDFVWQSATNYLAKSHLKSVDTADATETTLASGALDDEAFTDITATVLGRSETDDHFAVDLRAAWSRLDAGSPVERRAVSQSNALTINPSNWEATLDVSSNTWRLRVTGEAGKSVRWSALVNVQIVKLEATSLFDRSTLALTRWHKGSFSGAPWVGSASAGVSASHNLSTGGANPSVGSPLVNGFAPCQFDGVNDFLVGTVVSSGFSVSAFSGWDLIYFATAAADPGAGNRRQAPAVWDDGGQAQIQMNVHAGGVTVAYAGGSDVAEVTVACSTNAWHLVQYYYNGTALFVRVDSGAWTSVATTPRESFTGTFRCGINFLGTYWAGSILESAKTNTTLSTTNFDEVKAAINSVYALSL